MPPVLAMVKNPHYLYRMTVLGAVAALANYVPPDVLRGTMLPVVIQCAKDKVRAPRRQRATNLRPVCTLPVPPPSHGLRDPLSPVPRPPPFTPGPQREV